MSQQTVSKLKELLFDREAQELDELRQQLALLTRDQHALSQAEQRERNALARRVDELTERTGNDALLQRSVARVLDGAVRDAETVRHNELSQALAPMVRRTFRAELKSETTQEDLASTLYPKIGDMIRRFIASAMRDMMETINRRLESGLTNNRFMLKVRSIATGRSMAELALADTQRFTVDELYLVRRGSGELIHHWSRTNGQDGMAKRQGSNRDTIVSAFLTAITSFAEEAFATDRSSLRSLDLDDHRIYLRASPAHLLAAKCSGTAAAAMEQVLDAELLAVLEAHQNIETARSADGDTSTPDISSRALDKSFDAASLRIEQRIGDDEAALQKDRGGLRPLKIMAVLFGLPVLFYAGWQAYFGYETRRVQSLVDTALAGIAELNGYPVNARVEPGAGAIWVSGLVPSSTLRTELLSRIAAVAPGVPLSATIGVLPSTDVRTAVERAAVQRALDLAKRRLEALTPEFAAVASKLDAGPERTAMDGVVAASTEVSSALVAVNTGSDVATLNVTLHRAIEHLRAVTRQIGELIGKDPAASVAANAALPATPLLSANELSTITELLASQVTALEHAHHMRPLERRNADLEARLDAMAKQVAALKIEPTPREALAIFLKSHAIFFSNGVEYRDPTLTREVLDGIVELAKKTDLLVRVIGYTDEAGDPKRNQTLSQQRAETVAEELAVRGLPRYRIVAVGRGTAMDVAPRIGAGSANRRVEFEMGFPGEGGGTP